MLKGKLRAGGLLCGLMASSAGAAITPVFVSVAQDGVGFRWTYRASIGDTVKLKTGDYFTLYDVGATTDVQIQNASIWTSLANAVGPTALLMAPADDPAIPNITFQYTGPNFLNGDADLGTFSFLSATNLVGSDDFTAQSTRLGSVDDGKLLANIGQIPLPGGNPGPIVPEPSAVGLAGIAALPLVRRKRA